MKFERMFLIAFFGNYVVNNIVAGLASLVPASQGATNPMLTAQYFTFVILGLIALGLMAWWYLCGMPREGGVKLGGIFGIVGFIIAIITALVTGISGIMLQTGAFPTAEVLARFGPYIMNKTTLVLLVLWVAPAVAVGWFMQRRMSAPAAQSGMGMQRPM